MKDPKPTMRIDPERLALIRCPQEERLENELKKDDSKKIIKMVREIESYFVDMDYEEMVRGNGGEKEEARAAELERQVALAHGIVVTKTTSPNLFALVERSIENIGILDAGDLTINIQRMADTHGEDLFNAFCASTRSGSVFISFTPMLLNILNDREIMDVIGHELGHAVVPLPDYVEDYFYFVWGTWMDGLKDIDPDIPEDDFRQIYDDVEDIVDAHFDIEADSKTVRLIRLKEMTVDRFGLVASRCYRDTCSSLMKQQTLGIDQRFFDYDPRHMIRQLDEMGRIHKDPAMRWIFDATHPVLPARIAVLDAFYRSAAYRSLAGDGGGDEGAGDDGEPAPPLSPAQTDERIDLILRKSELLPEGEDLDEIKLVTCLFTEVVRALSYPERSVPQIVRRMVWEKYRDLFASIPLEVFDLERDTFRSDIRKYGARVASKEEQARKALMRNIVGFLKDKKMLRHETKNLLLAAGASLGLKRSAIVTYLKRVGAWGRYIRKR